MLLPAYFASRILAAPQFDSILSTWQPPAFGFALTSLGFGLAFLFAKRIGPKVGLKSDSQQRAFALCVGICNYGYIPLPLAESFYPEAVVPLILHNVGVELALWSVGVAIISGGSGWTWHKMLISPPFLAVIIACCVQPLLDPAQIPNMLAFVFDTLGNCAIPVGLLLSGAIMMDFLSDSSWMKVVHGSCDRDCISSIFHAMPDDCHCFALFGWTSTEGSNPSASGDARRSLSHRPCAAV